MGYADIMNDKNKKTEAGETWKFPNVGDSCAGVLVKRENKDGDYKGTPTKQVRYSLIQDDGSTLFVYGRYANAEGYKAFKELDEAPLGVVVAIKYLGVKKTKDGVDYKSFDVWAGDEVKSDVLTANEFGGKIVEPVLPPF
jgi:hypothetical protein